jgi:hypothetical protein
MDDAAPSRPSSCPGLRQAGSAWKCLWAWLTPAKQQPRLTSQSQNMAYGPTMIGRANPFPDERPRSATGLPWLLGFVYFRKRGPLTSLHRATFLSVQLCSQHNLSPQLRLLLLPPPHLGILDFPRLDSHPPSSESSYLLILTRLPCLSCHSTRRDNAVTRRHQKAQVGPAGHVQRRAIWSDRDGTTSPNQGRHVTPR